MIFKLATLDKTQKGFRITKKVTKSKRLTDAMDILMKKLETFSVHNNTNITQLNKFLQIFTF